MSGYHFLNEKIINISLVHFWALKQHAHWDDRVVEGPGGRDQLAPGQQGDPRSGSGSGSRAHSETGVPEVRCPRCGGERPPGVGAEQGRREAICEDDCFCFR